jgi:hypothetical protein
MVERIVIKGGADEFEAAVIAVVLDKLARDERAEREGRSERQSGLSAWVRALYPDDPVTPRDYVVPEGR